MSASSESQLAQSQLVPGPDLAPVLAGLLRRDGIGLLRQRARLAGLLRDYAPAAIRDIRLLLTAYDAGAPARLESLANPVEARTLAAEADRLVAEFGCARLLALNAVETWGRALASLRAPGLPPPLLVPRSPAPVVPPASAALPDEERPGWVGRWGGIGVGVLLVLTALARWLGLV